MVFSGVVFAAALLIQGSAQVYSRKVEYLYSLVLQTLEFLSHKRYDSWDLPPYSRIMLAYV